MNKINELRRKKESKQEEFKDLKNELKQVSFYRYLILFLLLVILIISIVIFARALSFQEDVYNIDCANSNNCVIDCMNFYKGDVNVNHSLECEYKCLTYKYCDDG